MWEPSRNETSKLQDKPQSLDLVIKPIELEKPVPKIIVFKDSPLGIAALAGDLSVQTNASKIWLRRIKKKRE